MKSLKPITPGELSLEEFLTFISSLMGSLHLSRLV